MPDMKIIINTSLMIPIYEQIADQIKRLIRNGELKENDSLPSVRALSKELKISALTVKKAYDSLESEGFTVTVHGKRNLCDRSKYGTSPGRTEKGAGGRAGAGGSKGQKLRISDEEIRSLLDMFWRDENMLKIEHLKKNYDTFSLDCSLELRPGYVTGLIGQNGAGKSTTFKAVLGLIAIDGWHDYHIGKRHQGIYCEGQGKAGGCVIRFGVQRIPADKRFDSHPGKSV